MKNQTLRQIVHTSIGGDKVRVVLSNAYGTAPLEIGGGSVALRDKDAAIQPRVAEDAHVRRQPPRQRSSRAPRS